MVRISSMLQIAALILVVPFLSGAGQPPDSEATRIQYSLRDLDCGLLGQIDTPGQARMVDVTGSYAYIADNTGDIRVVDISDLSSPTEIRVVYVGIARYLVTAGDYLYVATYSGYFKVVDITMPESATVVASVYIGGSPQDIELAGAMAFVANGVAITAIDVSEPTSPSIAATINLDHPEWWVEVDDDMAFIEGANSGSHLSIVDISDLAHPVVVSSWASGSQETDLLFVRPYLYVCDGDDGLLVIDCSDPADPFTAAAVTTPEGQAFGIAIEANVAVVSIYRWGFKAIDISTPAEPKVLGARQTGEWSYRPTLADGLVYLAELNDGMRIYGCELSQTFDVSVDVRPGNDDNLVVCSPPFTGSISVAVLSTDDFDATTIDHTSVRFGPNQAPEVHRDLEGPVRHEVDVDGDGDLDLLLHFRVKDTGIACDDTEATLVGLASNGIPIEGRDAVHPVPSPNELPIPSGGVRVAPNPFNPVTWVEFTLDRPGTVRVSVYDIRGRLVRTLANQAFPVGEARLAWYGRDATERNVPSGIYHIRVETGDRTWTRRAVLLK